MGLIEEKKRAEAQGDKLVNGFKGAIRSLDILTIEEGDVFTIPETFEVYEQSFGEGGNTAQYIWIETESGAAKKFYPGTFTKRRRVYNEDGSVNTNVPPAVCGGTAAELFRTYQTVAEGMDALRGKKLKVPKVETVRTKHYTTGQIVDQQIPTIDLV